MRHETDGDEFDALIIGGGNDISAEHYGGEVDAKVKLDPEPDALEIEWIKAVEGVTDRHVLGVQWHPEYLFYLLSQFRLFRWLLSRAEA